MSNNKDKSNLLDSPLSIKTKNDDNGIVIPPKSLTKKPPPFQRKNSYSSSSSSSSSESDEELDSAAIEAELAKAQKARANGNTEHPDLVNKETEKRQVKRNLEGVVVTKAGNKHKNSTAEARKKQSEDRKRCIQEENKVGANNNMKYLAGEDGLIGQKVANCVTSAVNSEVGDEDYDYKFSYSIEDGGIDDGGFAINKPKFSFTRRHITITQALEHLGKAMGYTNSSKPIVQQARYYFKSVSGREFEETAETRKYSTGSKGFNNLPRIVFRPTAKRALYAVYNEKNKAS